MDTKSIKYFITCYEMKSLNKAARSLYITPQGLGKTIDRLEEELHVKLFERSAHGIVPTAGADYFYSRSRELMQTLQEITMEMNRLQDGEKKVRVGYSCGAMRLIPIDILEDHLAGKDFGSLEWEEGFNDEIEEKLLQGESDIAFMTAGSGSPAAENTKILSRRLSAVVYEGHPLYDHETISMKDLEGETLITLSEKYQTYHLVQQRCQELDFAPSIHIRTMESSLIYMLVTQHKGIGIDVEIHDNYLHFPVKMIPITDSIPWALYAVCLRHRSNEPAIADLLDFARSAVKHGK
ncbi:MAG: LysR family transcriptional regulator [Anaerovoracaceae bacterium]|nr:LysR family transcriptional regulator [Bacillota bacterium]MDY2671239.1 LysR family transcriptional regulator [Anaerovoracaceae bacterium]